MNPFTVLAALAADWARLSPLLDPAARPALRTLLADLRTAQTEGSGQLRAAERAVSAALDALPAEEAARLRPDGGRFTGTSSAVTYEGFEVMDLCRLALDGNPMVGPFLGPVRERLLAAPALRWDEVVDSEGAVDPRLIVLTGERGERRLPRFQFEAGTLPWDVVLEANSVLRADRDPWGSADWWLSGNAWTGTAPARLLGHGRDAELLGAARVLTEADDEG